MLYWWAGKYWPKLYEIFMYSFLELHAILQLLKKIKMQGKMHEQTFIKAKIWNKIKIRSKGIN